MGNKTVSPSGRRKLYQREGCPLKAYRDSRGIPTIGCGHTGRASLPLVRMGMTITQAQADAMFVTDTAPLIAMLNCKVMVPITQNMFDALVSLGHNIGWPGLQGSTVIHRLNQGDYQGAAHAFLMWDKPPELLSRRMDEMRQFLGHDAEPAAPVVKPVLLPSGREAPPAVGLPAPTALKPVPAVASPGVPAFLAYEQAKHDGWLASILKRF